MDKTNARLIRPSPEFLTTLNTQDLPSVADIQLVVIAYEEKKVMSFLTRVNLMNYSMLKHIFNFQKRLCFWFTIGIFFIEFSCISFAGESGNIQQKEYAGLENSGAGYKPETENHSKQTLPRTHPKKYSYRYYPSSSIYYDVHRKLYFYPENGNWKIFASLPRNIKRELGDYVKLEMDADKPYIHHDKHVKDYPSIDSKKGKKNLFSKIIFVLFFEHASK